MIVAASRSLVALAWLVTLICPATAAAKDELPDDLTLVERSSLVSLKEKFKKKIKLHEAKLPALKRKLSRTRQMLPQELWPIQRKLQDELKAIESYKDKIDRIDEELSRREMEQRELDEAKARLKAMEETADGFRIAEADLRLRGPGEFLGSRQSGPARLRFADLTKDLELARLARDRARAAVRGQAGGGLA